MSCVYDEKKILVCIRIESPMALDKRNDKSEQRRISFDVINV